VLHRTTTATIEAQGWGAFILFVPQEDLARELVAPCHKW
jgi:hypothetical protein